MRTASYEEIVLTNSVKTLTAAKVSHPTYGQAQEVLISGEGGNFRITYDGTDPAIVAETGHLVMQHEKHGIDKADVLAAAKMINSVTGTPVTLHITYWYF